MARGLELNDSLQVALARHDAIASGVSLPMLQAAPETSDSTSSVLIKTSDADAAALESDPSSSSTSSESETYEEGDDVKNDFIQLTKRLVSLNNINLLKERKSLKKWSTNLQSRSIKCRGRRRRNLASRQQQWKYSGNRSQDRVQRSSSI